MVLIACRHGHHRSVALSELVHAVLMRLQPSIDCDVAHLGNHQKDGMLIETHTGLELLIEDPVLAMLTGGVQADG